MNLRRTHVCLSAGNLEDFEDLDQETIERSVAECPQCRIRYATHRAQRSLLRSWAENAVSPDLWAAVRDRLQDPPPQRVGPPDS